MCVLQLLVLPPVEELQANPETRSDWMDYAALDAKATYQLADALQGCLLDQPVVMDERIAVLCILQLLSLVLSIIMPLFMSIISLIAIIY
jgi:hypothetical protein